MYECTDLHTHVRAYIRAHTRTQGREVEKIRTFVHFRVGFLVISKINSVLTNVRIMYGLVFLQILFA